MKHINANLEVILAVLGFENICLRNFLSKKVGYYQTLIWLDIIRKIKTAQWAIHPLTQVKGWHYCLFELRLPNPVCIIAKELRMETKKISRT